MSTTDLDILICTYNRALSLDKTLQSLMEMDVPPGASVRLIIVDNNSSDDTRRVVEKWQEAGPLPVKYFFEPKQGKSNALNAGIGLLGADAVAFTDDDVFVDGRYAAAVLDALGRYPDVRCFGGRVMAVYPERLPEWLDLDGSMAFLRSTFVDREDGEIECAYGDGTISSVPGGCNMFFRRSAIEKNGQFRTDLGPMGRSLGFSEDTEYCQRMSGKGERFMYIPGAVIRHPLHAERLDKGYLVNWQYNCGKSEVLRAGGYGDGKRLLNVPRYLFRKYAEHFVGSLLSATERKRFYHQLRRAYAAGEIVGHRALAKGESR